MKTLIVYTSKTGVTADCANKLASLISTADCINLDSKETIHLQNYDQIILGSSVYVGMIRKSLKQFITTYHDELLTKHVSLFTCGANDKINHTTDLMSSIPADILNHLEHTGYFGWDFRKEKLGFFSRFVMKKIQEKENLIPGIQEAAITKFSQSVA